MIHVDAHAAIVAPTPSSHLMIELFVSATCLAGSETELGKFWTARAFVSRSSFAILWQTIPCQLFGWAAHDGHQKLSHRLLASSPKISTRGDSLASRKCFQAFLKSFF